MASSDGRLSQLQEDILAAFFDRAPEFFLTGGAALARYYLHHRATEDLDLFALPDVDIGSGVQALVEASVSVNATARALRESSDFKRYAISRGEEMTLVDLVVDRAPQVAEKLVFGRVRVDAPREIAANKLCALLDRLEVRDLFDLRLLLESGLRLEDVLEDAQRKHAGADPATLAFALSTSRIPPTAPIPAATTVDEVERFRRDLITTFTRLALPPE
jgi:predicted nucleotidyltransferase component of viral defense system